MKPRPVRLVVGIVGAVALWYLFGCGDPVSPNIHPAPLVEWDSTVIEEP